MSISILCTLFSWKTFRLLSSANNFCIDPNDESIDFVFGIAGLNWFISFVLVLPLYIPEYISEASLVSGVYSLSVIAARTPKSTVFPLKAPLILDSSICQFFTTTNIDTPLPGADVNVITLVLFE